MSKPVILYYAPPRCLRANKTKALIVRLGVRLISVSDQDIFKTPAELIGEEDIKELKTDEDLTESGFHESAEDAQGEIPSNITEEMIVFYNFSGSALERVLRELKKSHATADLKAVVTPTNVSWPFAKIYGEIKREREYIKKNS